MGQKKKDLEGTEAHGAASDDANRESETEQAVEGQQAVENSTSSADQPKADRRSDRKLIDAVESNADLLQELLTQFEGLYEIVHQNRSAEQGSDEGGSQAADEQLRERISELEEEVEELRQQNEDLAAQVASTNVQEAVSRTSSGGGDALSWDDRKKLILRQLEDESFDAESFVASLKENSAYEDDEDSEEIENPVEFVQHLYNELERCNVEISKRDQEIQEYRALIQERTETQEAGLAVGAAAIAEIVDADDLIKQERERLQMLQAEWEEKFREGEIQASLERAKLSRERKALASKQAELEQELERVRRQARGSEGDGTAEPGSASSRRWMVKLGLNNKEG